MSTNLSQGDGEVYEENWYDTMAGVMGNVLEVRFCQSMAFSLEKYSNICSPMLFLGYDFSGMTFPSLVSFQVCTYEF